MQDKEVLASQRMSIKQSGRYGPVLHWLTRKLAGTSVSDIWKEAGVGTGRGSS